MDDFFTSLFLLRELRGRELRMELSWKRRFRSWRSVTERSSNTALALPTMYTLCRNSHWLLTAEAPAQFLQSHTNNQSCLQSPTQNFMWSIGFAPATQVERVFTMWNMWNQEWSNTHFLTGGQLQHHRRLLREQGMDGICNTVQTERNGLEDKG